MSENESANVTENGSANVIDSGRKTASESGKGSALIAKIIARMIDEMRGVMTAGATAPTVIGPLAIVTGLQSAKTKTRSRHRRSPSCLFSLDFACSLHLICML